MNKNLIISIPCVGKTTFNWRTLFIYEDHLVMQDDDKETIIFDEKYENMVSLSPKYASKLINAAYVLEFTDGKKVDINLDIKHTTDGKGILFNYNPEISQIRKTLPGFINKLIAKSKDAIN